MAFVSSTTPFNLVWSGLGDSNLRPALIVARDGSGFRPVDIGDLGGSGSSASSSRVGITGSNGSSVSVVSVGGNNAFPVIIASGSSTFLTGTQTVDPVVDYSAFSPLGFNGSAPTTAWVAFTTLSSYFVPQGKSLKIDGYSIRAANSSVSFMAAIRETMYGFSWTGNSQRPLAPTLVAKTITGFNGLTTGSTYSYRTVFCNTLGRSAASPTGTITLAGAQNSVDIFSNALGDGYLEVYRSPANGGSGTEVFVGASPNNAFSDCIPDSELSSDIVPSVDSTSGVYSGYAYSSGYAPRHVVLCSFGQTSGVTALTPAADIVYKNIYRKTRSFRIDTISANTFTEINTNSSTGTISQVNRIPRRVEGHEWDDGGINQILHVSVGGNGGNFAIFGYNPLFYVQPTTGITWTTEMFPKTISIPSGKEVVVAVSNNATLAASRVDLIIYGRLV